MKRIISTAAMMVVAGTGAAFAADLVVEPAAMAPETTAPDFYASFFVGGALPSGDATAEQDGIGITFDTDFDTGFIVGGAIGTEVFEHLRGEIEFSVIQANVSQIGPIPVEDGDEATSTGYNLLGNLWYDIDTGSTITPYVGGGIGYGYNKVEASGDGGEESITSSGLLYQLGVGVKFDAADNIAFDLGYRYRVMPDADLESDEFVVPPGGSLTSDATTHILQAGLTIGF